jgi:hypothetical protein
LEHFPARPGVFGAVVDAPHPAQFMVQRLLYYIRRIAHFAQACCSRPPQIMNGEMRHAALNAVQGPVQCALSKWGVSIASHGAEDVPGAAGGGAQPLKDGACLP